MSSSPRVEPGTDPGVDPAADTAAVTAHPAVVRVRAALDAAGAAGEVVVLGEHARTAAAAAEQLGVTGAQIANSLVFAVPDPAAAGGRRPLLVLTSGAHRVDTAKVAGLVGAPRSGTWPRCRPWSTSRSLSTTRCGRPPVTRAPSSRPHSTSWCRSPA